jgi:energy-converting hydrogenase Eha subunit C
MGYNYVRLLVALLVVGIVVSLGVSWRYDDVALVVILYNGALPVGALLLFLAAYEYLARSE